MAPTSNEKVDFFKKVGPESAPAGRVNVDEIFRNFIFMFYWTKRSLKKKVSEFGLEFKFHGAPATPYCTFIKG